jgi:hypothetical protein
MCLPLQVVRRARPRDGVGAVTKPGEPRRNPPDA